MLFWLHHVTVYYSNSGKIVLVTPCCFGYIMLVCYFNSGIIVLVTSCCFGYIMLQCAILMVELFWLHHVALVTSCYSVLF